MSIVVLFLLVAVVHGYVRYRHRRDELHHHSSKQKTSIKKRVEHG